MNGRVSKRETYMHSPRGALTLVSASSLKPSFQLERLGTNYAPTETEITEIHRLVQQLEPTREQLTVQMEELKARLDACSSFVSAHLALLTPIPRMPSDIIINIFLLCVPPMWS
jgi:hypothetical protein